MNKKNLIVSSTSQELYTTQKILESAVKLKYSVKWINPYLSFLPLDDRKKNGLFFHRTTGSNYDDFDLLVSTAHGLDMMITNPVNALKNFRSKDQQYLFFLSNKLPHIPTFLYRGPVTDDIKNRISMLDSKKNQQFILKLTRGNQGIGVNYIKSEQSLWSLLETFHAIKDQRFIIQPFVEHEREWRLLVSGEKILVCIEKTIKEDEFRGNAKRSKAKLLKNIPLELSELALRATALSGLHYAGIDIIEDKNNGLKILEVNPVPGFEQAEELSGLNVARELILHTESYKR